jgi:phage gpG-like protein
MCANEAGHRRFHAASLRGRSERREPAEAKVKASLTGDIKALDRWAQRLRAMPKAMDELGVQLAETALELTHQTFEESKDPYGRNWAKLKFRKGKPLRDTGGLKSAWYRKAANRNGFRIANAKKYAAYHQDGTGIYGATGKRLEPKQANALRIPVRGGRPIFAKSVAGTVARPMVPNKKRFPKKWIAAFQETADEFLVEHFR